MSELDLCPEGSIGGCGGLLRRFFYFFIFYFRFLQKYIFDLEIYRNIPRPPRSRVAGTWPPGSRAAGAYPQKKEEKKMQTGPWEPAGTWPPRPPGCGATGLIFCNLALFAK